MQKQIGDAVTRRNIICTYPSSNNDYFALPSFRNHRRFVLLLFLGQSIPSVIEHLLVEDRQVYLRMLFTTDGVNHNHLYHYCDVTATTGHWSMENHNALTPTRIQLKHSPIWSTVSTSSEWMESNTKKMWFYPPRTECITHWNQHHDLEWQNTWNI